MRDIALTLFISIVLLFAFRRPWLGILLLAWLGYMNPHRMCFGFAYTFPFFFVVSACTVFAIVISREPIRIPWTPEIWLLLILIFWITFSFLCALNPDGAWRIWIQTMKTMIYIFLALVVITDRKRLELLLWTIALSFGFYGIKGGLFTIVQGGVNHVVGPDYSFIAETIIWRWRSP